MELKLRYFGVVAEITGRSEEVMDSGSKTAGALLDELKCRYPAMSQVNCKVSVNHKLAAAEDLLQHADELAVLPPFSGG